MEIGLNLEVRFMRVLDVGCGSGQDLARWGVTASDEVIGLDIDDSCLVTARVRFPNRTYLHGTGECLKFENESFDRAIFAVALPYMNIQKNLERLGHGSQFFSFQRVLVLRNIVPCGQQTAHPGIRL